MAEQRVAADGHSVAPSALPPCPQQNAIVRLTRCVSLLHPPPIGPQNPHKWRAPRRARHLCLSTPKRSASERRPRFSHEDAACRSLLCPMHGVQLRPEDRRPEGPTDDGPSAATRLLGWASEATALLGVFRFKCV